MSVVVETLLRRLLEVIILKLKENDEAVLECIKKLITALGENH